VLTGAAGSVSEKLSQERTDILWERRQGRVIGLRICSGKDLLHLAWAQQIFLTTSDVTPASFPDIVSTRDATATGPHEQMIASRGIGIVSGCGRLLSLCLRALQGSVEQTAKAMI
jgi:hypothetical protein